ncbi:hypothetical protein DFJ43DRAFT_1201476 [Lentinula guzmanii]|uniref:Uncharacterized protein n=1 Tax=Lentinula guzmanii TaxID=2804957 RepID=A0AA38JD09_9AGAR|nr:hypothetical protein DFJ43DRAFT_1201476 [Lentinula guzmanii]
MSSTSNDNETIQQCRERILQAQAARQRAREEEIARQEAEFAAEMERIEAEEKAAREAEEKRKAEEQRVAEEKRKAEEKRIAEERKMEEQRRHEKEKSVAEEKKKLELLAEEKRKEEQRLNEAKRREEEAAAEAEDNYERSTAYTRLVEENKKEKERAAKELERRRKSISKPPHPDVQVLVPITIPRCKTFKSKAIISDESDDEVVEQPREVMPRGAKRKRTIKMIAKGGDNLDPDVEKGDDAPLHPDPSQPCSACSRCVMIGRPSDCRPQSTQRPTQACEVCHQQRQRCSWSGDNAARRLRSKRVKLDEDDVYEGPEFALSDPYLCVLSVTHTQVCACACTVDPFPSSLLPTSRHMSGTLLIVALTSDYLL